jgi:hypothetical protein
VTNPHWLIIFEAPSRRGAFFFFNLDLVVPQASYRELKSNSPSELIVSRPVHAGRFSFGWWVPGRARPINEADCQVKDEVNHNPQDPVEVVLVERSQAAAPEQRCGCAG